MSLPEPQFGYSSASQELSQASASAFMARVYQWMVGGLALTGAIAWYVATNQAVFAAVYPYFRILLLAELGLVVAFSFLAQRLSGVVAALMFIAYAAMNGLFFSVLFYIYELGSISSAFFVTAGTFAALSAYGTFTKKDLSAWSTFLFMGLVGVILAGIVNIFVQSDMLGFVKSAAAIVVFAGLTAYDTQKLRQFHAQSGYASAGALAVSGALTLYLDFINLFLNLLRLFGRRR